MKPPVEGFGGVGRPRPLSTLRQPRDVLLDKAACFRLAFAPHHCNVAVLM